MATTGTPLFEQTDYRAVLRDELARRQTKNHNYSQRAFARDLGIGPNRLSEILAGKQGLSAGYARQVAGGLNLEGVAADYFCELVRERHARSQRERQLAKDQREQLSRQVQYHELKLEVFRLISDWPHLAIVELSKLPGFQPKAAWIARRLGRPETEVKEMLHRLEKVGLLTRKKGKFEFSELNNVLPESVPSDAVKGFHESVLKSAQLALWEQDIKRREYSTTLLAFDECHIPEVKKRVQRFWREIDRDFGGKGNPQHLYALGVQFFALTEGSDATIH